METMASLAGGAAHRCGGAAHRCSGAAVPISGFGVKCSRFRRSTITASVTRDDVVVARDDLLGLIADEERGLRSQKDALRRQNIIRAFDALAESGAGSITTDSKLSATWRMLWTTEKEQLFIVEKAPIFGTAAGDILQVIDAEKGTLNNVITFPPAGAFVVSSTIEIVSNQRVNFRFCSAVLRGGNWSIPVPPYGKGWFDSVYLDDKIRLAKDIRGDYLIVERAPYKWEDNNTDASKSS